VAAIDWKALASFAAALLAEHGVLAAGIAAVLLLAPAAVYLMGRE
jgi:hypothetical protein